MPTLVQATKTTKTTLRWMGILFVVFLIIRFIFWPLGSTVYNNLFPEKAPPPTVAFDKLPHILFPQRTPREHITFSLETALSGLPPTCNLIACPKSEDPTQPKSVPDKVSVYPFVKKQVGFSSLDKAKQKAGLIGFKGEGQSISSVLYQWTDETDKRKRFVFNIITESFDITTAPLTPPASTERAQPRKEDAIATSKNILTLMSLLPKDIDDKKTKITLLKIKDGRPILATSLAESDFIKVDLYRKNLHDLPIVYPNPSQSLISFLVSGRRVREVSQIAETHYSYKSINTATSSSYPIKTAKQAFDELGEGKGYISYLPRQTSIPIRKVYLAYYEGNDALEYLLPVFVFEGDNFAGLVEAVKDDWLD